MNSSKTITYNTIAEAFLKGSGDVFFIKDNQFVSINRKHIEKHNELLTEGFLMLSYSETIQLAQQQEPKKEPVTVPSDNSINIRKVKKPNSYNVPSYMGDVYEFSDADPGL